MRVFVSGGCGFVGAYLIPHLLGEGHEIICYDVQMFGHGHLSTHNDMLKIIKEDLSNERAVAKHIACCEAVIHLAGVTSDRACQVNPGLANRCNVEVFKPLLQIAKDAGVKRFIFPSSVAAYGSGI